MQLISITIALLMTPTQAEALTIERIFASPTLEGPSLMKLKVAPTGDRVTFLRGKQDDREQLDLWEYHIADEELRLLVDSKRLVPDEGVLSEEEKGRRERQRLAGLRGIIEYAWAEAGDALLFPLGGDLYYYRLDQGSPKRLTATESFETDPQFSPRGNFVSFIRDQNLYAVDVRTGEERQLTSDGGGTIKNGMAEFVAQEEMDRDTGYWWSGDERRIAFLKVDQSPVAVTRRYEIDADEVRVIEQRYPYTGTPNVIVRLGVVEVEGGAITWIDLGEETDIYLPRVKWLPDSRRLSYQVQSRDQTRLDLNITDVAAGSPRIVLTETAPTWVNLHDDLRFLERQDAFVWSSERTGFRHLYLYATAGELIRPLTAGDWLVDRVEGVDEAAGRVYFTATEKSALEKHLYSQSLDTETPAAATRITRREGFHEIEMPKSAGVYIDTYSSRDQPPQVSLKRADGEHLTWLVENRIDEDHPYRPYLQAHRPTEFGTLEAADGQRLYYRVTTPLGFDPARQYPVFVHVYGGPGAQMVTKSWSRRILIEQYMAQHGFVVFALDNRGSKRRGKAFEDPIHLSMGTVEVDDQVRGVEFLKTLPYVDPDRIGVFGWSYGGYMVLMSLFQHPDAYAAGVSVAPVTDWSLYDTHYTERYMGTPEGNAEGYARGSVLPFAERLSKPLLIAHGMADDNVLFTHSTKVFKALQDSGKLFDQMTYPGGKHGLSGTKTETHAYRTVVEFFEKHLGQRQ